MVKILDDLRQDHRNLAWLWDLLGRELSIFKEGGRPDYDLVEAILDYCINYPDLCHHPKENLIFDKLADRDSGVIGAIGELRGGVVHITDKGRPLMRMVTAVFDRYLQTGAGRHSRAV